MIKKVIKLSGFQVKDIFEASNGREGLDVLSQNWIDVVLTDINMPEMNGIEFLKNIRDSELFSNIPVVLITTEGSEAKVQEAYSLGANGYVTKPFTPETIKDVLVDIIGEPESIEDNDSEMDF